MKPVPLSSGTGFFRLISIIFIQVTLLRHIKRHNYKHSIIKIGPENAMGQYNRIANQILTLDIFSERFRIMESEPESVFRHEKEYSGSWYYYYK